MITRHRVFDLDKTVSLDRARILRAKQEENSTNRAVRIAMLIVVLLAVAAAVYIGYKLNSFAHIDFPSILHLTPQSSTHDGIVVHPDSTTTPIG